MDRGACRSDARLRAVLWVDREMVGERWDAMEKVASVSQVVAMHLRIQHNQA